ncbi:hypothetical protein [Sphaerisporangium perillae]|uniref:hypothetical protein n=1 Tax=Sphaerisporangium perillae TaxID=2935860 RepID=UPI00200C7A59|nr:hypothetical protein [Sphaerisporangium perillae]
MDLGGDALDAELSALIGKRDRMGAERAGGGVLALRDALLSPSYLPDLDDGHGGEPTRLEDIAAAVDSACARYWRGDFPWLVAHLLGLIAEARLTHSAVGESALYPLVMAYDLAASLMVHLGRDDLAAIGAERAITTAHGGNDELLWATLHGTYAWVLLHQGRMLQLRVRPQALHAPHGRPVWALYGIEVEATIATTLRKVSYKNCTPDHP